MRKISEDEFFEEAEQLALSATRDPALVSKYAAVMSEVQSREGGWKMRNKQSQNNLILKHLTDGKSISPLEAMGVYGVYRLAARIFELREDGHKITKIIKDDGRGRTYAEYFLA
jgi:hypothetical protein